MPGKAGRVRHPHLSDPALQFNALRKAVGDAISQREIPLWNNSIWAGAPLVGDAQSMVGSPVTWIHLLLPAHVAQDLAVCWLLMWMGLGMGLLVRHLGAGTWGSVTAAAAAMTSPYHCLVVASTWRHHRLAAVDPVLDGKANTTALALCTAGS